MPLCATYEPSTCVLLKYDITVIKWTPYSTQNWTWPCFYNTLSEFGVLNTVCYSYHNNTLFMAPLRMGWHNQADVWNFPQYSCIYVLARQIFDAIFNQRLNLFYTSGILIRHIPGFGVGNSRERLYVLRGTKSACIQSMVGFYRCVSLPAIQPTVELYPCFTMYTARFVLLLFACHCYDNCKRRGVQSAGELRLCFILYALCFFVLPIRLQTTTGQLRTPYYSTYGWITPGFYGARVRFLYCCAPVTDTDVVIVNIL